MSHIFDVYNIIFLVIAVVIFMRLRSVLGTKTGSERPPERWSRREEAAGSDRGPSDRGQGDAQGDVRGQNDNVVPMPRAGSRPEPAEPVTDAPLSAVDRALQAIMSVDRGFDRRHFLDGARVAYEMIVGAFAAGDRKTLRPLLSREVFDGFSAALDERDKRGEKVETTFVGIEQAEIVEASLENRNAQITVRFVSQTISATRDRAGAVIDGDPNRVNELVDVWTFARDVGTSDPNWRLVATHAPD